MHRPIDVRLTLGSRCFQPQLACRETLNAMSFEGMM